MEYRHSYIMHWTIVLHFETITGLKHHIDQPRQRSDGPNETQNVPPSEVWTTHNFLSSNDQEPQPADTEPEFEPEHVAQENEENDTERKYSERIRNKPDRFM